MRRLIQRFLNDDATFRDRIVVNHSTQSDDEKWLEIEIRVSVPQDAYERLTKVDWTREEMRLWVNTPWEPSSKERALVWREDPTGRNMEWNTGIRNYDYLESLTFSVTPSDRQKICIDQLSPVTSLGEEQLLSLIKSIHGSLDQGLRSLSAMRNSMLRAAWVIGVVVLIAAVIR